MFKVMVELVVPVLFMFTVIFVIVVTTFHISIVMTHACLLEVAPINNIYVGGQFSRSIRHPTN